MRPRFRALVATSVFGTLASSAFGQCVTTDLFPPVSPPHMNWFGAKIRVAGDEAAISGYTTQLTGGTIHLAKRTGSDWQFTSVVDTGFDSTMLLMPQAGLCFDGTTLVAAGTHENEVNGWFVVVYEKVGGVFQYVTTLTEPYSIDKHYFGQGVGFDGDTIAAPCVSATVNGIDDVGNVSIFTRIGGAWVPTQQIVPNDPFAGQYQGQSFGGTVELRGDVLLVSTLDYVDGDKEGAIYVYRKGAQGFVHTQVIRNPNPATGSHIGDNMAFDGTRLVTTAYGPGLYGVGRAYVFADVGGTFVLEQTLATTETESHGTLGYGIAIDGDRIAMSADPTSFGSSGTVRIFERVGGKYLETDVLQRTSAGVSTYYGTGLGFSGATLLVGDYIANTYGPQAGAVDVVHIADRPYSLGCAGSGQFHPTMDFSGCPVPGSKMGFEVHRGLGGSFALAMIGAAKATVPMGAGCSLLAAPLVGQAVGPLPLDGVGPGQGDCNIGFEVPLGLPTTTLYFQAFVADPGMPLGFSNTNGVELSIE